MAHAFSRRYGAHDDYYPTRAQMERDANEIIKAVKAAREERMATRVKVVCNQKLEFKGNEFNQHQATFSLSFSPVYSGSEENKRFYAATPGGNFQFFTVNGEAAGQFEMGKEYYFDIFAASTL